MREQIKLWSKADVEATFPARMRSYAIYQRICWTQHRPCLQLIFLARMINDSLHDWYKDSVTTNIPLVSGLLWLGNIPCQTWTLRPSRHARRENHISSCNQSRILYANVSVLRVTAELEAAQDERGWGDGEKNQSKLCWHQGNSNQLESSAVNKLKSA